MNWTKIYMYDNCHACKCVLHYGNKLIAAKSIEVDNTFELLNFDKYSDIKSNIKSLGVLYKLGLGNHLVKHDGHDVYITVKNFVDDKKMLHSYNMGSDVYITQQVILTCDDSNVAKSFVDKSIEVVKELKNDFLNSVGTLKKYIYDSKDCYWNDSHSTNYRSVDSLFLKEGEKERILKYIDDFTNPETKTDYIKFNIPYKSNILLYGKPGTGKTTTILTIASHLKTNIGLIPISPSLDDAGLINALSDVKKNDCKIVVIEDIDCLFNDRKKHDSQRNSLTLSGLLNCMDGLFRAEGIIVFLTTNRVEDLDEAMIRSSRIDFRLEYTFADKYQIEQCFNYYFPDQRDMFSKFYDKIQYKEYIIADFQEFFFKYRKCTNIIDHIHGFTNAAIQKNNVETLSMYS